VQQLHAYLFARSALSLDQYWYVGLSYPFYFVTHSVHGCGFAEEDIHRRQI
jgi:hypothetical protein